MAAMGRMKSPTPVFLRPPAHTEESTARGSIAASRSMTVAAIAAAHPEIQDGQVLGGRRLPGRSRPRISTPKRSAKIST